MKNPRLRKLNKSGVDPGHVVQEYVFSRISVEQYNRELDESEAEMDQARCGME
jgi:hypothetical protein